MDQVGLRVISCVPLSSGSSTLRRRSRPLPKKDIYAEAKGQGFDIKILREVVRIRKKDPKERDEAESLLDVYLHAIGTAAPLKKAA